MGCSSSRPAAARDGRAGPRLRGYEPPQQAGGAAAAAAAASAGPPPRVKLVLLGDSGVGKSCLAVRYVRNSFDPDSRITVGAAFMSHSAPLPSGQTIKLELWDTAGQERYLSLAPLYFRGAHAAVVVYDVTSAASFQKAQFWIGELQRHASGAVVMVLVGNKTDLADARQVTEDEARALADSHNMLFVEASAKTGAGVCDIFEGCAAKLAGGLPVSVRNVG
ncbi:RABF1 [Scenedesmus sp. PABB004]|nr:RABF1 [Scenedesmus sp. PABB004]